MNTKAAGIGGVTILRPILHPDQRGLFCELWSANDLSRADLPARFVQMNYSLSKRGALRGLHYQIAPHGQDKLVTVMAGCIYDVVVDLRRSSPTFGAWEGRYLGNQSHEQLFVPAGLAHGFLAMSEDSIVCYACTRPYSPLAGRSIRWNDPDLAIDWPIEIGLEPIVSPKDAGGLSFADCEKYD